MHTQEDLKRLKRVGGFKGQILKERWMGISRGVGTQNMPESSEGRVYM